MSRIINHTYEATGAWFGAKGILVYEVSTGDDDHYDRDQLRVYEGAAEVLYEPEPGEVGELRFAVRWSYGWWGKSRLRYRAYTAANEGPVITRQLASRLKKHPKKESGEDVHTFRVPAGYMVSQQPQIVKLKGDARVTNGRAVVGDTGSVEVKVSFSGHATYFVLLKVIDSTLRADLSNLQLSPSPGIAGEDANASFQIRNTGSAGLTGLVMQYKLYAKSLDDVPQFLLDSKTEEERTRTIPRSLGGAVIAAGASRTVTQTVGIPETVSDGGPSISPAGTYRVVAELMAGTAVLDSLSIEDYRVAKPS